MKAIADFIKRVYDNFDNEELLAEIKKEVKNFTVNFPLYPELINN